MFLPASASNSGSASRGSITAAPSTKVGSEKSTVSRRVSVMVAAPQRRSILPLATASKRSVVVTGSHSIFRGSVPSWVARLAATASQISTE